MMKLYDSIKELKGKITEEDYNNLIEIADKELKPKPAIFKPPKENDMEELFKDVNPEVYKS